MAGLRGNRVRGKLCAVYRGAVRIPMALSEDHFGGAKLALFIGGRLLVIRRDDRPDIPWPGHWDFPGGGREGGETPAACVLRETAEETGLILHERALTWGRAHDGPQGVTWFFAAHLDGAAESQVRLGDEGQEWCLMSWQAYCAHDLAIPHFAARVAEYVRRTGASP
jgi:8-oxo-dGTP diphosphatase